MATTVLLSLSALGCITPVDRGRIVEDSDKRGALVRAFAHRYPDAFQSVHRATLSVRGRQFVLDGYLRVDTSGYRMLAATGFGTTLFEIEGNAHGEATVVRHDSALDPVDILAGPAHDIRALYLDEPGPSASLVALPDGDWALTETTTGGLHTTYIFDRETGHCVSYIERRKRRMIRTMRFEDFVGGKEQGYAYPRRISIRNRTARYRVEVRVASVTPIAP